MTIYVPNMQDKPRDSCRQQQLEVLPFTRLDLALLAQGLGKLIDPATTHYPPQSRLYIRRLMNRINRARATDEAKEVQHEEVV